MVGLAIVAIALTGAGSLFFYLRSASTSDVSGSLTIDEAPFAPRRCRSGKIEEDGPRDRPRFHGVDLLAAGDRAVRVLEDPAEGTTVLVVDPGEAPRQIDRGACERFEVQVRETGTLIMEVWGMEGSVDLACPDVHGQVRFESCYGGR